MAAANGSPVKKANGNGMIPFPPLEPAHTSSMSPPPTPQEYAAWAPPPADAPKRPETTPEMRTYKPKPATKAGVSGAGGGFLSGGISRQTFLAIAVIFHLIYAMSIFDIYFVSPIVHGMAAFGAVDTQVKAAPASRLVLFVGDGLRADKAMQFHSDPTPPEGASASEAAKPRSLMPFIRSKILDEGTFGVSHTRVPTESRPGHVALIAGLYEDVSAVTTGWKHNPVNFDSVFNRSRHTWSWGSPDILPMFKDGAVPGRIDAYTYGAEAEDFTSDAVQLDIWVFDRVKQLFADARTDETLAAQLRQDKIVFFLHLLGLDTTGHAYRPYSKEYLNNIKVVDQGIKEVVEAMDEFYADDRSAFVFTADHGMSDWGSHGDGHPDNTRTPLVAWGSGVAKPVKASSGFLKKDKVAPGHEDGFSADWHLSHVRRNDVSQADVAALMAHLVGLDFPVNSVGELPLPYLAGSSDDKAEALLTNARQILEMYRVKEGQKQATQLRYTPYPGFAYEHTSPERRVQDIQDLIARGRAEAAITKCEELIQDALQGLRYLQTYDWLFLRALVTIGYLGWAAFAMTTIIDLYVLRGVTKPNRPIVANMFFLSVTIGLVSVLVAQESPRSYYAYAAFPIFFWEEVFARRDALIKGRDALFAASGKGQKGSFFGLALRALAFVGLLEALVQSYSIRELYSVCYLLAISWPFFYGGNFVKQNQTLVATWSAACIIMSGFTFLPANKVESLSLILVGGGLMFGVGALYLLFETSIIEQTQRVRKDAKFPLSRAVTGLQIGLVLLSMFVTYSSVTSLQARLGLPLGTQIVGWLVMVVSVVLPFLHSLDPSNHYLHRLLVTFLTFSPTFIILTISWEGLFYFAFCMLALTWVRLEHRIYRFSTGHSAQATLSKTANGSNTPALTTESSPTSELNPLAPLLASTADRLKSEKEHRPLALSDFRISLFSLFLLQSAFFSTGNIASVSSFSLDAVYRLIPVFDPFSQAALLVLKIIVPFLILCAHLGVLNRLLGIGPGALLGVVVAMGDWLTLRFFWMVKDEGSWLEIGSSISQFLIASALGGFVAALEGVSEALVRGVEVVEDTVTEEVAKSIDKPDCTTSS